MASALVARRLPSRPPVVVLLLALVVVLAWASRARGEENDSARLYGWRVTTFAPTAEGIERGADAWGARLLLNSEPMLLGLQVDARLDVSAQAADFRLEDLSSWQTGELYAALSRPLRFNEWTIGPAFFAGGVAALEAAPYRFEAVYGAGGRLTFRRSWLVGGAGVHGPADRVEGVAGSGRWRGLSAIHIEIWRTALVADWVSGAGGFRRLGVAFRIPAPGGGR